MKEVKGKDRFGNEYTDSYCNDGRISRCTQTNMQSEFEFLGDTYSLEILEHASLVKEYLDDYHNKIKLCRDQYGRLLLFFYDEEMNFDGGPDREDFLWVIVKDEADADELSQAYRLSRLREPYIAGDEKKWMAAHQYIEQKTNIWNRIINYLRRLLK